MNGQTSTSELAATSGFLDKAKLILGVSGGGYRAASRAFVARGLEPGAGGAGATGRPYTRPAARRSS
jgi:hypothetical protein